MSSPHRPTPDHEPPAAAALAVPCAWCGTAGGYVPYDSLRPVRAHGYCGACYTRIRDRKIRHGYRTDEEAMAHILQPSGPGCLSYHRNARERAEARQSRVRAHLDPFLTDVRPVPHTPYRYADLPQDGTGDGPGQYGDAPWRPAPWLAEELAAAEAA